MFVFLNISLLNAFARFTFLDFFLCRLQLTNPQAMRSQLLALTSLCADELVRLHMPQFTPD